MGHSYTRKAESDRGIEEKRYTSAPAGCPGYVDGRVARWTAGHEVVVAIRWCKPSFSYGEDAWLDIIKELTERRTLVDDQPGVE